MLYHAYCHILNCMLRTLPCFYLWVDSKEAERQICSQFLIVYVGNYIICGLFLYLALFYSIFPDFSYHPTNSSYLYVFLSSIF